MGSVMLAKKLRVSGKEVRFLTKKRQLFSHGLFIIFFVDQYPNRQFHQISFHIPIAISKRAVHRHQIKRILISSFEQSLQQYGPWNQFYKCFVSLNKNKLEPLITLLQEKSISELKVYLTKQRESAFRSFFLSSHENKCSRTFRNHSSTRNSVYRNTPSRKNES